MDTQRNYYISTLNDHKEAIRTPPLLPPQSIQQNTQRLINYALPQLR